jgi:glutaminase
VRSSKDLKMAEDKFSDIPLQMILDKITSDIAAENQRGKTADYIQSLARIDLSHFGICVVLHDGRIFEAGDSRVSFSIQSISKVFTLALALRQAGDMLWSRVGKEPSGNSFSSIVQLEHESGIPRNPFINAGAIVTTEVIMSDNPPKDVVAGILEFVRDLSEDRSIQIDEAIVTEEMTTGYRNFALANFLRAYGNLGHSPELSLSVYFHHCAIAMTCRQLALAGRFLANGGKTRSDTEGIIQTEDVRRINALMLTCGQYDNSGNFAFRVGLPAKSGVGGGILAIVPDQASIAVWSPGLNKAGTSVLGMLALECIVQETGWSIF